MFKSNSDVAQKFVITTRDLSTPITEDVNKQVSSSIVRSTADIENIAEKPFKNLFPLMQYETLIHKERYVFCSANEYQVIMKNANKEDNKKTKGQYEALIKKIYKDKQAYVAHIRRKKNKFYVVSMDKTDVEIKCNETLQFIKSVSTNIPPRTSLYNIYLVKPLCTYANLQKKKKNSNKLDMLEAIAKQIQDKTAADRDVMHFIGRQDSIKSKTCQIEETAEDNPSESLRSEKEDYILHQNTPRNKYIDKPQDRLSFGKIASAENSPTMFNKKRKDLTDEQCTINQNNNKKNSGNLNNTNVPPKQSFFQSFTDSTSNSKVSRPNQPQNSNSLILDQKIIKQNYFDDLQQQKMLN